MEIEKMEMEIAKANEFFHKLEKAFGIFGNDFIIDVNISDDGVYVDMDMFASLQDTYTAFVSSSIMGQAMKFEEFYGIEVIRPPSVIFRFFIKN